MVEHIKRFIECVIPVTICNLRCSYCYIIQRHIDSQKMPTMKYSAKRIGDAFKKERWGGTCYINICGEGETLVPKETLEVAYCLLNQGHFVNITTNGTLTNRFEELKKFPKEFLQRMNFSFSFHYLELKRLNLLDVFFNNIKTVKKLGASFVLQLNMCDEYIPFIEEIKQLSKINVGAYPQVAITRYEVNLKNDVRIMTKNIDEYMKAAESFDSPLFRFTRRNFNVKRKEFCYAGDWSFQLNLATGILHRCYCSNITQNIFEDVEKPIRFIAMGHACSELYCMNSSHFMSLGIIPEIETPTYAELRNRIDAGWYSERMKKFLSGKLKNSNNIYGNRLLLKSNLYEIVEKIFIFFIFIKKILKKLLIALGLFEEVRCFFEHRFKNK